jgi:hypothetical protein
VVFIDAYRARFGVEPICRVLSEHDRKIAPNTYWVAKKRSPSARAVRDGQLKVEVARVHHEAMDGVYGADKVWAQLNREGRAPGSPVAPSSASCESSAYLGHAVAGPIRSPPAPTSASTGLLTWSIASSPPRRPTAFGWPT